MTGVSRGEQPDLNHLLSMIEQTEISAFITGHLIVEGLLVQFLEAQPGAIIDKVLKTNFPQKVEACLYADLFGPAFAEFLLILNDHRNHFAHKLGHRMSFDDAFKLAEKAAARGSISQTRRFMRPRSCPAQIALWR